MTSCSFIVLCYLSFILHVSKGSDMNVAQTVTVNPDRSASISCEHTADPGASKDFRLNVIHPGQESKMLCQDEMICENMVMYKENPKKCIFVMFNIGPEQMKPEYECQIKGDKNYTRSVRTTLVEGQKEAQCQPQTEQWTVLEFILIGFLVVTLIYSFVITGYSIRQKVNPTDESPENSVYVDMRKAPLARNPVYDMS